MGAFAQFKKEQDKPAFDMKEIEQAAVSADGHIIQELNFSESDIQKMIEDLAVPVEDIPNADELFEPEVTLTEEQAAEVIAQTVAALSGTRAPLVSEVGSLPPSLAHDELLAKTTRQGEFLTDIPDHIFESLKDLATMIYGQPNVEAMLSFKTAREAHEKIRGIMLLDLDRIWNAYATA